MQFNYGRSGNGWVPGEHFAKYRYESEYKRAKIEIIEEPSRPLQPFKDQDSLVERMFDASKAVTADPFQLPAQRADLQHRQMDLLLEQLGARHAINYQIRKDIEYEECWVRAKLHEVEDRPIVLGHEGRFESELIKQLQQLRKERHAESVACWRDISRILSDVCDRWTEYADESRKARMMDDGL